MDEKTSYSLEDREGLIDLIEWYRDEYHGNDFGHTTAIEAIRNGADLEVYYQMVDYWLDGCDAN